MVALPLTAQATRPALNQQNLTRYHEDVSALSNKRYPKKDISVPASAQQIIAHAFETFGSEEKAWHWLERPNGLFAGAAPIDILQTDPARYELIEDELMRIDYGVFV